jgi:hypothetical protein
VADPLLGVDLEASEHALRSLAASVLRSGGSSSAAEAAPFLIAVLDRGAHPSDPVRVLQLLAHIAVGDPEAAACGGAPPHVGALEATPEEAEAEQEGLQRRREAVAAGSSVYVRWLRAEAAPARAAAAHVLAFVRHGDELVDEALRARARDPEEAMTVRASALLALGLRRSARAEDLPAERAQELGEAALLEAAGVVAALGSTDAPVASAGVRRAIDVLVRGVPSLPSDADPLWPPLERLLLARLARTAGRSARAQSALLRALPLAQQRSRAESIAAHLLVLAFGEPTAAAFSDWRPSLEVFPGAGAWSAEQRVVLRTIEGLDLLWPASAEVGPRVRYVDACPIQVALKRMLELSYYPSRHGLRAALAIPFSAGADGA